jgi:tetratricopeptide (TPR) repeat protein
VSGALAVELQKVGTKRRVLSARSRLSRLVALSTQCLVAFSHNGRAYLIEQQRYTELITQAGEWYNAHSNAIYEDGIFYWGGLAELQISQFEDAVGSFSRLVDRYPTSVYAEDGLLRKGAALFYAQRFEESRDVLYAYVEKYPAGNALDQAYFFLGEVEYLAGNLELALDHFTKPTVSRLSKMFTTVQPSESAQCLKSSAAMKKWLRTLRPTSSGLEKRLI